MDINEIRSALCHAVKTDPDNYIRADYALESSLAGLPIYDAPLVGCAPANDPIFQLMRSDSKIYGPALRLPEQWLPGANSVISFFLPYSREVRDSNRVPIDQPSALWLHARIEGQAFLMKLCRLLSDLLEERGFSAVIPAAEPDFEVNFSAERLQRGEPGYLSSWSERHAAFAAGLGSFGLSKHIITEKGVCGRFGSVISTAAPAVTPRAYTEPYEYCTFCGACIPRCPVGSISLEKGKDVVSCNGFVEQTKLDFAPRYGCGKCQLDVPCENSIPKKLC